MTRMNALKGTAVITIEAIGKGGLHPVQQKWWSSTCRNAATARPDRSCKRWHSSGRYPWTRRSSRPCPEIFADAGPINDFVPQSSLRRRGPHERRHERDRERDRKCQQARIPQRKSPRRERLLLPCAIPGFRFWRLKFLPEPARTRTNSPFNPSVYLGIDADGTVYIVAHRSEMGTTSRTSVPMILADELDADWKRVKLEQAIGDPRYGDQNTDGSHSVRSFYQAMREAGAAARMTLVQAAAQKWGVPTTQCATELHVVVHKASGRKLGYGELAAAASKLPVPKRAELQFKPKSAWRYVGKSAAGYDLAERGTGKAIYGMDVHREGMVYASIEHPPVVGGKVMSYDERPR